MKASRDANHPNRRCCRTNKQLRRAYQASALAARLARTESLMLLYLNGLLQYLVSAALTDGTAAEMLCVADMLQQALGQSVASRVKACCHVWLTQSNLSVQAGLTHRTRESPCYVSGHHYPVFRLGRIVLAFPSFLPNSAFQCKVLHQSFAM